jgi:hypothetical protein
MCAVLLGCGGHPRDASPPPPAAGKRQAATLLTVQRNGGKTATLDLLTVRRDGSAELDKRYGGAGRRRDTFRITKARMAQIRRGLRALPRRSSSDASARKGSVTFLLRFGGRDHVAQLGALSALERPLIRALDGVIAGKGRE